MLLNQFDCIERIDQLSLWKFYIPLSNLERAGWVRHWIEDPETVAQHSISSALMVSQMFRKEIEAIGANIIILQDTLLIHDIHEPRTEGKDITPHDNIDSKEKKRREMEAIQEILGDKPHLLNLWLDFEEWRTLEWRLAKEIDKFQAIFIARKYENKYRILWLIEEFYSNAVIKKQQITTNFLVQAAVEIYNNKTR